MKTGFVSIIGKPNVGKSTFLNNFLGKQIAIVSNRPQTTRNQLRGIYTDDKMQIVFIDTPGIHKTISLLDKFMNKQALKSVKDVEIVLYMISALDKEDSDDNFILKNILEKKIPIIILITKIDLAKQDKVNNLIKNLKEKIDHNLLINIIPFNNLELPLFVLIKEEIYQHLTEGPLFYLENEITDIDEIFFIKELIREKCLKYLNYEIPHRLAVYLDKYQETKTKNNEKLLKISGSIIVEKDTHKMIVLGKHGQMIKTISSEVRQELEKRFNLKVFLELHVKVKRKWFDDPNLLKELGYK